MWNLFFANYCNKRNKRKQGMYMAADENEAQLAAIREAEEHFDIRVWEVTDDGDDAGK